MQLTTSGRKQLVDEFLFGYFGSCFLCALYGLFALCLFFFALMVRYPARRRSSWQCFSSFLGTDVAGVMKQKHLDGFCGCIFWLMPIAEQDGLGKDGLYFHASVALVSRRA
jgi:hypothetical protein